MKKRAIWCVGALIATVAAGCGASPETPERTGLSPESQAAAKAAAMPAGTTTSIGMKMVLIPAGQFQMGSKESAQELARVFEKYGAQADWFEDECPLHRVRITKAFYLGAYEVTQAQYRQVMGENPSHFKGDPQRPVEMVSWSDAVEFCRRLSQKEGEKYRLPTEAEWEYACRAGTSTRYGFGDDPGILGQYAWWNENSQGRTQAVGRLKPNAWGLFDMQGNVWEWCADRYGKDYYGKSPAEDPVGPSSGAPRVLRGGSWCDNAPCLFGCAFRNISLGPVLRSSSLGGFRVARTLTP